MTPFDDRRASSRWLLVSLFAGALACGGARREPPHEGETVGVGLAMAAPTRPTPDPARASRAHTAHVVIVSIDGLRPDAIEHYAAPVLLRLMREGRYAEHARTILPSTTIPSHASMLTGVEPSEHHITWNDDKYDDRAVAVPSVFVYVKREGLSAAAFFSKSKFSHLFAEGSFDVEVEPSSREGAWPGAITVDAADQYLSTASPNLLFVHIADPDFAGHSHGWMTDEYGEAVRSADLVLARLLARADSTFGGGQYTVIVTADHGGHARTHGSSRSDDTSIPWIVWGEAVAPGAPLTEQVRTMDTTATALWLLGIEVPRSLSGHAVVGAFAPVFAHP